MNLRTRSTIAVAVGMLIAALPVGHSASGATAAAKSFGEPSRQASPETVEVVGSPHATAEAKGSVDEASAAPPPERRRLWTLQMNLCSENRPSDPDNENPCEVEPGPEILEGAEKIREYRPDIVTLNEICLDDMDILSQAFAETWPNDHWWYYAVSAGNENTGEPWMCDTGGEDNWFGNATMGHIPESEWQGMRHARGYYEEQDSNNSDELRSWGCTYLIGAYFACSTHLATNTLVAGPQCNELMSDYIPEFWDANGGQHQTVVGGDFNLDSDTVQFCAWDGWGQEDDGTIQHVLATDDIDMTDGGQPVIIDMDHTDHPGLLVRMRDTEPR